MILGLIQTEVKILFRFRYTLKVEGNLESLHILYDSRQFMILVKVYQLLFRLQRGITI